MAAVIALVVFCGIVAYVVTLFNGLVSLRRQTANAFAQIDIQLRRRCDLIPALVETVRGYMAHEKDVFTQISEARNRAVAASTVAEKAQAEQQVKDELRRIYALVEDYPELKSDATMLNLQAELRNAEDKIAFARQYYNDVVTAYNTSIETFPVTLLVKFWSFPPQELFIISEPWQRENVKVAF